MADAFDVLIVGSGQNSLTLGNYLARAGLKVAILERRLEAGGGVSTEELDVHGFWHNTGSVIIDGQDLVPLYRDLKLQDHYADYLIPSVQSALVQRDGRALVLYSDLVKTVDSIRAFSPKDAERWRGLVETFQPAMNEVYGDLLKPPGQNGASPQLREFEGLSPRQAAQKLFESPAVQALVLWHVLFPRMVLPDYAGMGWVLPLALVEASRARLFVGGQHELIQALWNAFIRAGGDVRDWHEVRRIRVEGGKATGVELADGRTLDARCVVSNLDLPTTFGGLLEGRAAPAGLSGFELDELSIFAVHLALREPPKYRAGGDVNQAYRVNLGLETPEEFDAAVAAVRSGQRPKGLAMMASISSLLDPVQAHPGKHVSAGWQLAPLNAAADAAYLDELVGQWREYAPNLTKENILLQRCISPREIAAKWVNMAGGAVSGGRMTAQQMRGRRPLPELSGFRTSIENLYLCGGALPPGLGLFGAQGYVAAGVIAKDLGITPWWEN